jgi:hypothetical protein
VSQRIPLPDPRVSVEGAIETVLSETGVRAHRLRATYAHQVPLEVDFMAGIPSGVRLRCTTDSATIGLEGLPLLLQLGDLPARPAVFDVTVDDAVVGSAATTSGNTLKVDPRDYSMEFLPGEPATVTFEPSVSGMRTVEIWLPSCAQLDVRALVLDEGATLDAAPVDARRRWVHHGSSISHCMEADGPARTWPAVAARLGGVHLTNLGLAGQCQLDGFTARTIRDQPADLLSLKVGINVQNGDTMRLRVFPSALHGFLDTVREGHPDTPFLVVSPIIFPAGEQTPGPSQQQADGQVRCVGDPADVALGRLTLSRIRELVAEVVAARQPGDPNLHHLSGLELFDEPDVPDLPDGLHPNGAGYQRMGERFAAHAFATGGPFA